MSNPNDSKRAAIVDVVEEAVNGISTYRSVYPNTTHPSSNSDNKTLRHFIIKRGNSYWSRLWRRVSCIGKWVTSLHSNITTVIRSLPNPIKNFLDNSTDRASLSSNPVNHSNQTSKRSQTMKFPWAAAATSMINNHTSQPKSVRKEICPRSWVKISFQVISSKVCHPWNKKATLLKWLAITPRLQRSKN